jgi:cytochrome P450
MGICAMNKTAPGPRGHWLLGNLPEFKRDVLDLLLRSAAAYGDVVRFRLGHHVIHLANHPAHALHVLQRNQRNYDRETRSVSKIRRICGSSLLTTSGEEWRRERRLMQPAFHQAGEKTFAEIIAAAVREMVVRWQPHARTGEPLDVAAEMAWLAFTIAGRALFGAEVASEAKSIQTALELVLEQTFRRLGRVFDPPLWFPTLENRRFRRALATIDDVVFRIIETRRCAPAERPDLLDLLERARDDVTGGRFDDRQLRNEVLTLLLAGHETTASAMAWTFYRLSQHDDVAAELRSELAHELGGRPPGLDDLPRLNYLSAVIDESLRLHPPIWIIERRARKIDELGGFAIPAKSLVVVSPYSLHRHPEFWCEPEKFDPLRFAGRSGEGRPAGAYLPFGAGPHQCIGSHFALLEARLVVATMMQRFRFRLVPGHVVEPDPGITLRLRHGLRMIPSEAAK